MSVEKSLVKMHYAKDIGNRVDQKLAHFTKAITQTEGGQSALSQLAGIFKQKMDVDAKLEQPLGSIKFEEILFLIRKAVEHLDRQKFSFQSKCEAFNLILDELEKDFNSEEGKAKGIALVQEKPELAAIKRPVGARPVPLKKEKALDDGTNQPTP